MEELKKFKNRIIIFGLLAALLVEVVSLPIHGLDWKFTLGLVLGTGISIVNFNIAAIFSVMVLRTNNKLLTFVSYIIRLMLYGGIFYFSLRISVLAGVASLIGFMTLKVAIFILHGIIPFFKKDDVKQKGDLKKVKTNVFINYPQWITYSGGRKILTYRKFVKYVKHKG